MSQFDTVVLGGGVYAGNIAGLDYLKKHLRQLKGCRLMVFCDGATPCSAADVPALKSRCLTGPLADVPLYYLPGAVDPERLRFTDRLLLGLLRSAVQKKAPADRTPPEQAILETAAAHDWTDRDALTPLLAALAPPPTDAVEVDTDEPQ